jgi:hypothetical protein
LSGDKRFRRKRAAYWRWQDEFLRNSVILDQNALEEAAEEMRDLIEEEKKQKRVNLGSSLEWASRAQ